MGNFNLKSIWKQTGGTGGSTNYFKKDGGEKQIVNNNTEFFADVIFKRRAYVDQIDEGADSSVVNQWLLNDRITKAKNQIRTENNTFTGTNTFNTGNNLLSYTSTNTSKPDGEVLTRKDMKYVRVVNSTGNFTINGNNSYQSAQFEINGLTTGLNEFYVVFTTTSVDIGFDVAIQVNNLNYPNLSDIKIITTSNLTTSNVDQLGFIYVGFTIYGNNKFRWRGKNTHTSNITFNGFRVYKRVSSKISDN